MLTRPRGVLDYSSHSNQMKHIPKTVHLTKHRRVQFEDDTTQEQRMKVLASYSINWKEHDNVPVN